MRNKRLWILLGGLVILSAVFLLINFRLAMSSTNAEINAVTTSAGDRLPDAMQGREKISIVVVGEGPLVKAVQRAIVAEFSKNGMGNVVLEQTLKPAYDNPVLVIKTGKPGVFWTPLFATSQSTLQVAYASNGDTTFFDRSPLSYEGADSPALNMSGEYKVNDLSWGIISLPGYYQILADWLAHTAVAATQKLYESKAMAPVQ